MPKSVERIRESTVWNQQALTEKTISNNKPDNIIRDCEKRTCVLIDVAISGDKCDQE
jgi:hypothetical protein